MVKLILILFLIVFVFLTITMTLALALNALRPEEFKEKMQESFDTIMEEYGSYPNYIICVVMKATWLFLCSGLLIILALVCF